MSDLFADRLGNITIASGVARLDFLRLAAFDPEKKEFKLEPSLRLSIPLDALDQAVEMLNKVREQLSGKQPG